MNKGVYARVIRPHHPSKRIKGVKADSQSFVAARGGTLCQCGGQKQHFAKVCDFCSHGDSYFGVDRDAGGGESSGGARERGRVPSVSIWPFFTSLVLVAREERPDKDVDICFYGPAHRFCRGVFVG